MMAAGELNRPIPSRLPPPPPRSDLNAVLEESEAIVARVRAEMDRAWNASYRCLGMFYFALAVFFLLFVLDQSPSQFGGSWAFLYYLCWFLPVAFFIDGAFYFLSPARFRAWQTRSTAWWRRRFFREKIPDSRVAEMMGHLQMMRREIGRIDTTVTFTTVALILFLFPLAIIGSLTASSTYQLISGVNPDVAKAIALSVVSGAGVVIAAFLLLRARGDLRRAWQLSHGLAHCHYVLRTLENRFWAPR